MCEREPMKRVENDEDEMNLPTGKTCADCVHCRRCTTMFGHIPTDEVCDWSPSRFFDSNRRVDGGEA
ncbi:hypothetical protein CIG19_16685 [Enterobacterales bacterium CwR94]|nr:hypothetical protein CIG19_16685 [Enterobacterales bacterium CwR94]